MDEYSVIDSFRQVSRRWWIVALCVFLGGAIGWGFHFFQPPVYEATAVIVAQIDFTQTGELNELEQDQSMGAVLALFASTPVLQKVQEDARLRGIAFAGVAYGQNFSLERRRSTLTLKVRDRDPKLAARLANIWAEAAYQALNDASQHALRAREIGQVLALYAGCRTPIPGNAESCPLPTPVDPKLAPTLEADLNRELAASSAIHPAMIYNLSQKASVPAKPVALRVEFLALAGALVGFVCGGVVAGRGSPLASSFAEKPRGDEVKV